MPAPRCRLVTVALAAAAAAALPAVAAAGPQVTDRYEGADGTLFTLATASALHGKGAERRASFRFEATPPRGAPNPYGEDGVVGAQDLRLAGPQATVTGLTVACGPAGARAIYGTAARRVKRAVATLAGGRKVTLTRREPPKAWKFDGWVIGVVTGGRRPVLDVTAFDADGRRMARADFQPPADCSAA